jgi:hypothetical protein
MIQELVFRYLQRFLEERKFSVEVEPVISPRSVFDPLQGNLRIRAVSEDDLDIWTLESDYREIERRMQDAVWGFSHVAKSVETLHTMLRLVRSYHRYGLPRGFKSEGLHFHTLSQPEYIGFGNEVDYNMAILRNPGSVILELLTNGVLWYGDWCPKDRRRF